MLRSCICIRMVAIVTNSMMTTWALMTVFRKAEKGLYRFSATPAFYGLAVVMH